MGRLLLTGATTVSESAIMLAPIAVHAATGAVVHVGICMQICMLLYVMPCAHSCACLYMQLSMQIWVVAHAVMRAAAMQPCMHRICGNACMSRQAAACAIVHKTIHALVLVAVHGSIVAVVHMAMHVDMPAA